MKYVTLAHEAEIEILVLKSRFIASGREVRSVEEAESFLAAVRTRYPDASHHCYAFRVAGPPVVDRFSDDGEPAGTAGRPILTVLEHHVYNAIVVVSRYFGGIKLGTGGLVKAYTQAAQRLLEAAGLSEKEPEVQIVLQYPYGLGGTVAYQLRQMGLSSECCYAEDVTCYLRVPLSRRQELKDRLSLNGLTLVEQSD